MENTDSYPVFHTRLGVTMRRRGERLAPVESAFAALDAVERVLDDAAGVFGDVAVHDTERAGIPVQVRRSPGARCPVPGCTHHHDDGGGDPWSTASV